MIPFVSHEHQSAFRGTAELAQLAVYIDPTPDAFTVTATGWSITQWH